MEPSKLMEMAQAKREAMEASAKKKAAAFPDGRNTVLGAQIRAHMKATKTRGNPKDFVLFVGHLMLDEWGKYQVTRSGKMASPVSLVHKRDLHNVIGPVEAAKFWNQKTRRRTSYGQQGDTRVRS